MTEDFPDVTRVEVITDEGREFVRYECSNVQVSLQDEGQTLKVFLKTPRVKFEGNYPGPLYAPHPDLNPSH